MPGRPATPSSSKTGHTAVKNRKRTKVEKKMTGKSDKLMPDDYLTEQQQNIFWNIVHERESTNTLGNLDVYVLNRAAITIDRLQALDRQANQNPEVLQDAAFIRTMKELSTEWFRYCGELGLSPQARAKYSGAVTQNEEKKPSLMDILNEEDD